MNKPMTRLTRLLIVALVALAANPLLGQMQQAPDVIQADEVQVIDDLGNASLTMSLKLTAKQYIVWKQKYGNNPSILRRDLGRLTSQYEVSDFKLAQDDMNRKIDITLAAKGVVTNKGDGLYEFKIPKEWTGGQRVGHEYRFNYIQPLGPGSIMQHNVSVSVPQRATNLHDQLGEEGEKVIQYAMPQPSYGLPWMIGTIVFGILGLAGVALGLIAKPAAPPTPPPAGPAAPPAAAPALAAPPTVASAPALPPADPEAGKSP